MAGKIIRLGDKIKRGSTVRSLLTVSLAFSIALPAIAIKAQTTDNSRMRSSISDLDLKVGEFFVKARTWIIKHGWKPIRMHGNDDYEYSGTEKYLAARGFHEVDSCSTDAGVLCTMYYSKRKECLRLETRGEQVNDIRLRLWLKECPDGGAVANKKGATEYRNPSIVYYKSW